MVKRKSCILPRSFTLRRPKRVKKRLHRTKNSDHHFVLIFQRQTKQSSGNMFLRLRRSRFQNIDQQRNKSWPYDLNFVLFFQREINHRSSGVSLNKIVPWNKQRSEKRENPICTKRNPKIFTRSRHLPKKNQTLLVVENVGTSQFIEDLFFFRWHRRRRVISGRERHSVSKWTISTSENSRGRRSRRRREHTNGSNRVIRTLTNRHRFKRRRRRHWILWSSSNRFHHSIVIRRWILFYRRENLRLRILITRTRTLTRTWIRIFIHSGTNHAFDVSGIRRTRMVNFLPITPTENGGFHCEIGDDGGKIGSGTV